MRAPTRAGSFGRSARGSISVAVSVLVVLLVVVSGLGLLLAGSRPSAPGASSGLTSAAPPLTHGDLIVPSNTTFVLQPPYGSHTYYQGGNITVESGGTLIVNNVTLSFVQFISDSGTAMQRLSHVVHFIDNGTVKFYNSNLTTDVQLINAYAKLNVTVEGSMTAWNSTFAFPGWLDVVGPSADLTLNGSRVTGNPAVRNLVEPQVTLGDTLFAPAITVTNGATLNVFGSSIEQTYADNALTFGQPQPVPLSVSNTVLTSGNNVFTQLATPTDSANLTQDWLYPTANFQAGNLLVDFNNANLTVPTATDLTVWYNGIEYPVAAVVFKNGTQGLLNLPLPTNLLQSITHNGMLNYLNWTGDFGAGASRIWIDFANFSGPSVILNYAKLSLLPSPSYDMIVSGAGSSLNSVDSAFGLTWSELPLNSTSLSTPYPWSSNKLLLEDSARAYLANATVSSSLPGVFSTSAVLPDATSEAFFYRWAEFNLTGRGGVLPIEGAQVSAYYAYTTSQANNATANALNDLQNPLNPNLHEIWGYVQYWDAKNGYSGYATSNAAGVASVLLASSNITAPTLPDGFFLGGYHIGIVVPAVGVASHWFNWTVSPYPTGVAQPSGSVADPDLAPAQLFPGYFGAVSIGSVSVLANGAAAANSTIRIGQTLGLRVVATDAGTAKITQVAADLYYNSSRLPDALLASYEVTTLSLTAPGEQTTFTLNWSVIDSVTGLNGWFHHNLTLVLDWNYNVASLGGGNVNQTVGVRFTPSDIAITSFSLPPSTLDLSGSYISTGTLAYNGSHAATILLIATPVGGGAPVEIAGTTTNAGSFQMPWSSLQGQLVAGTTYTLTAQATYNGRQTNYTLPGTYAVPAPPSSATSFLLQKFLGLPLWVWLAIAAAAVVGIVLFLFVARRQAAGKLVECGECGNLIPEDATVCPKCGAEFESDLIRCSRCASTIPANSKFCPECAAQLLGTPGEAASDPEKQAYADFTEKYRAEAKKELGDNYSEGAFWDWWKRQPTYTPFSQWSLQQGQGTARAGMTAPPVGTETTPEDDAGRMPPKSGGGSDAAPSPKVSATSASSAPPSPSTTSVPPPAAGAGTLKACPSCGKEIPSEYLVCPFCNAVTQ